MGSQPRRSRPLKPSSLDSDRRRLRDLRRMAEDLHRPGRDTKLAGCVELVSDLLKQGFNPIVWCRYIATADYLGKGLREALHRGFPTLQVVSITSHDGDDEVPGAKLDAHHHRDAQNPGRHRLPERGHQPSGQVQRLPPL